MKNITYWGIMFCLNENIAIGYTRLSDFHTKLEGRLQTDDDAKSWEPGRATYLSKEYVPNIKDIVTGKRARCPKCNGLIDFRAFPFDKEPKFVENYTEITDSLKMKKWIKEVIDNNERNNKQCDK